VAAVAAAALLVAPVAARAAGASPLGSPASLPANERTLSVSPVVTDHTLAAGSTARLTFTLLNSTLQTQRIAIGGADVSPAGPSAGGVSIRSAGSVESGAGTWIHSPSASVSIPSGAKRAVEVDVTAPTNATPGGHYAAVVFTVGNPAAASGLQLHAQITPLVLLTVTGRIHRDVVATLTPDGRFHTSPPLHWQLRVENRGNVHAYVTGSVRVSGLFGSGTDAPVRQMLLLPGAHRTQRFTVDARSVPDLLHGVANLCEVKLGGSSCLVRHHVGAPRVLLVPWWLFVVVVVVSALLEWRRRRRRSWTQTADDDEPSADDEGG
jgi:hypothetical protein